MAVGTTTGNNFNFQDFKSNTLKVREDQTSLQVGGHDSVHFSGQEAISRSLGENSERSDFVAVLKLLTTSPDKLGLSAKQYGESVGKCIHHLLHKYENNQNIFIDALIPAIAQSHEHISKDVQVLLFNALLDKGNLDGGNKAVISQQLLDIFSENSDEHTFTTTAYRSGNDDFVGRVFDRVQADGTLKNIIKKTGISHLSELMWSVGRAIENSGFERSDIGDGTTFSQWLDHGLSLGGSVVGAGLGLKALKGAATAGTGLIGKGAQGLSSLATGGLKAMKASPWKSAAFLTTGVFGGYALWNGALDSGIHDISDEAQGRSGSTDDSYSLSENDGDFVGKNGWLFETNTQHHYKAMFNQIRSGSFDNSDEIDSQLGNAASGAIAGAAIGSVVPGVGTAIGAGVGALVGGITSLFTGAAKNRQVNKVKAGVNLLSTINFQDALVDALKRAVADELASSGNGNLTQMQQGLESVNFDSIPEIDENNANQSTGSSSTQPNAGANSSSNATGANPWREDEISAVVSNGDGTRPDVVSRDLTPQASGASRRIVNVIDGKW